MARAVVHPVVLWVLQTFLETESIHYGHTPIVNTLKPAKALAGTAPSGGWHRDYPYHDRNMPSGMHPPSPRLGCQFNLCLDPFRPDNGGTHFIPASHTRKGGPARGAIDEADRPLVAHMCAPAGTAILYDARTWHRQCAEANVSGSARLALLNAATPSWVPPMMERAAELTRHVASHVPATLDERARIDVLRLFHAPLAPPPSGVALLHGHVIVFEEPATAAA
jgi:ectoine hydroxylase-related dioxygenase (phytanoyl-CoA dioxygenase family)